MKKPNVEKFKSFKFGMFIHWGLYSLIGHTEWGVMFDDDSMEDEEEVDEIFKDFDAESFTLDVPYFDVNTFVSR